MTSIDDDKAILYYDIVGSEAHSIMLYGIGFLTLTDLKKILQGLEEVKKNPDVLLMDTRMFMRRLKRLS